MPKLPAPPSPERLRAATEGRDVVAVHPATVLWRVHRTLGRHSVAWNALRHFGPVPAGRFDPHDPPAREQAAGVLYLSLEPQTCLAEVFQARRVVNRWRLAPYLSALRLRRPARLLDLSGTWPTRAGASQALNSGPRDVAQLWARAIRRAFEDLDGLWHPSSMDAGRPCVTLFDPAADALPGSPEISLPLSHPGLAMALAAASRDLGYLVV